MMEQFSPNVQDNGICNAEGKPITGGLLFRKYLLNRCQEDFERGWAAKDHAAATAAKTKLLRNGRSRKPMSSPKRRRERRLYIAKSTTPLRKPSARVLV